MLDILAMALSVVICLAAVGGIGYMLYERMTGHGAYGGLEKKDRQQL